MTYSVGGKVQAADYNNFAVTGVPNVNNIWSIGSSNSGYGQSALIAVSPGTKVLANPWISLVNTINLMAAHQGSTITPMSLPAVGNKVAFIDSLASNLGIVNSGRLNAQATGTDIINSATRTAQWGSAVGIGQIDSTVTITFGNSEQARYFFNAGGTLRISCSRTGGSATPSNTSWADLCSNIGTIALPAVNTSQTIAGSVLNGLTKIGGGGSAPDIYNRLGYYQLTSAPSILFRQYSNEGVYTNDNLQILYSLNSNVVTITVRFIDLESGGTADLVDGNLTVTAVARPPSTANIANSWGTPIVTVTPPQ